MDDRGQAPAVRVLANMSIKRPFACLFYLYYLMQITLMYYTTLTRVSHAADRFTAWEVQTVAWIAADLVVANLAALAIRGLILTIGWTWLERRIAEWQARCLLLDPYVY